MGGASTSANVLGSDGSNVLRGGTASDTLDGAGGDDVLVGAGGVDQLTGGAGSDTFVWAARDAAELGDHVADLQLGDDKLQFASSAFHVNGDSFDVAFAQNVGGAITGADLLWVSDTSVNDAGTLLDLYDFASALSDGNGMFVQAQGATGLNLFHVENDGGAIDAQFVANFSGIDGNASNLALSDFTFV